MINHSITLIDALNQCRLDSLRLRFSLLSKEKTTGLKKNDFVGRIHLMINDQLDILHAGMDQLEQHALSEAVYHPSGYFDVNIFKAKFGAIPNQDKKLCLFLYDNIMPADIQRTLKDIVSPPIQIVMKQHVSLPTEVSFQKNRESQAIIELHIILNLVDAQKISVSDKTFRPSATTMKTISAAFSEGEYYKKSNDLTEDDAASIGAIKAFAWPLLLQAGKLAKLDGKRLELTPAGRKALTVPSEVTITNLWNKWLKTRLLDELQRVDIIKGQKGKGKRNLSALLPRRANIADLLESIDSVNWISIKELIRYMRVNDLEAEVCRGDGWDLYICDKGYGSLGYCDNSLIDKAYVLCVLFEFAASLGLIDIAYDLPYEATNEYDDLWGMDDEPYFSRYDGLRYIRMTPLGRYVIGQDDQFIANKETQIYLNEKAQQSQCKAFTDKGQAQVYEFTDKALAKKVAHEASVKSYIMLTNQRFLIIQSKHLAKVKKVIDRLSNIST